MLWRRIHVVRLAEVVMLVMVFALVCLTSGRRALMMVGSDICVRVSIVRRCLIPLH